MMAITPFNLLNLCPECQSRYDCPFGAWDEKFPLVTMFGLKIGKEVSAIMKLKLANVVGSVLAANNCYPKLDKELLCTSNYLESTTYLKSAESVETFLAHHISDQFVKGKLFRSQHAA